MNNYATLQVYCQTKPSEMDKNLTHPDPSLQNPIRPGMDDEEFKAAMPRAPGGAYISTEEALARFRKGIAKGYKS